jgi:predicted flap endonuclease-1-like 5' DNA nuclease
MTISVRELRGITEELASKLKEAGLSNSEQLLAAAATPAARKALAGQIGAEVGLILELANRADLARIKGIGQVFSDLLEKAGVDTVKELATRRPDNLLAKLRDTNTSLQLAQRAPTQKEVEDWVSQAKALPPVLEY